MTVSFSVTSEIVLPRSTTLPIALKLRGLRKLRRAGYWTRLVAQNDCETNSGISGYYYNIKQ
jgi:hypothetical protein